MAARCAQHGPTWASVGVCHGMPAAEPPDDGDPEEAVVSLKEGINSIPWHPSSFGPPYVYKVCFLGAREAGKSSIARRMVAHTFQSDPYRPTMQPQQLFWRYNVDGKDVLVEIEDMPGLADVDPNTGELTPEADTQLTSLLKPLLWCVGIACACACASCVIYACLAGAWHCAWHLHGTCMTPAWHLHGMRATHAQHLAWHAGSKSTSATRTKRTSARRRCRRRARP